MITKYAINFSMTEFGHRQIGNLGEGDIYSRHEPGVISLAEDWAQKGIQFIETNPFPTEKHTSEDLEAMGLVGITLVIPKPEEISE